MGCLLRFPSENDRFSAFLPRCPYTMRFWVFKPKQQLTSIFLTITLTAALWWAFIQQFISRTSCVTLIYRALNSISSSISPLGKVAPGSIGDTVKRRPHSRLLMEMFGNIPGSFTHWLAHCLSRSFTHKDTTPEEIPISI